MEVKPLTSKINLHGRLIACLAFIASLTGCSATSSPNYASLGLVQVSGTVTLDGVPLSGVEVRLENVEESIYSYGITDDSGRFSLMFDSRTPGIIPGRKLVRVVAKRKSESEMAGPSESDSTPMNEESGGDEEGAASAAPLPATIPECYGKQSGYFVQIDGGTSKLALELRSDCSNVEKSN
jgi:hypothetical protein